MRWFGDFFLRSLYLFLYFFDHLKMTIVFIALLNKIDFTVKCR